MTKITLCAFLICTLAIYVTIAGREDAEALNGEHAFRLVAANQDSAAFLSRQKRFTCNSYACKAHCILLGRGNQGYCSANRCICK
ncbi:uncharacterized protein LOC105665469 [Ceratitis capitata]|uniref:uncharacterized protein LOC105665469 n=1 Tax=Ceratitis capitata TaxID=7213 RepID=UPI0006187EBD|nr:uncharacterized protein LOC105665469 [Ceratitis capitata]